MEMQPREFLTEIWGDPPPAPVYIYMLPTRQSIWFSHFENLDAAVALHADMDVYTSGGLGPLDNPDRASNRRVQQKDVAGIAGLWADIDVAHEVHSKKNLPQTVEQALEILELAEFQPTMLVNSGHGIQAWWLFTQPWLFNNTYENWEARRLSSWWHDRIQALYQNEGCRIDSVQNLDRVMRIPGTWNNKIKTDVRPVELMSNTGIRYELEQFLDLMPPDYRPQVMTHGTIVEGEVISGEQLMLDPDAEPPSMKMFALLEEDKKFLASWKESRKDWPEHADRSPSAYDMSLANIAARAGWTDQEICNLLIAKRREREQPLKLRENYYATTIAKARVPMERERILDRLQKDAIPDAEHDGLDGHLVTEEDRKRKLADVSILLAKIRVDRVEKFPGETATYIITTDKGLVRLDSVDDVLKADRFQSRVANGTDQVLDIKNLKKHWDRIAQGLLEAREEHDMGEAADPDQMCRVWIQEYIHEKRVWEDMETVVANRLPLMCNGSIHIHVDALLEWVNFIPGVKLDQHGLCQRLIRCGAEKEKFNARIDGLRTTYRSWKLPQEFNEPNEPEEGDEVDEPRLEAKDE